MKRIELHAKTKYSPDRESTIDIETIIWNAKENKERGIVFVDKDSIYSFPKIEKTYKELCQKDESFKHFKIGYGVELTTTINNEEYEIILLIKKQEGLTKLYKIISKYINNKKSIQIAEILPYKKDLLLGLMINDNKPKIDLSLFDYLEINTNIDVTNIKKQHCVVYSNNPNSLYEGEKIAKEVLYFHQHIESIPKCRLYLDTEDTLKECNDKEIVITNSNRIFDNLENIIINNDEYKTSHNILFDDFKKIVINSFKNKYKNPSSTLLYRLNEELKLIKELDYTYYFEVLINLTKFLHQYNEYYQLDGYINNSLVAYVLGITNIEPYNLPYELFFSEIPQITINISQTFYHKKMFKYLFEKYNKELIRCNYGFNYNFQNIGRVIKHYEIKKKQHLSSSTKDYISSVLADIPLYKENKINTFYLVPSNTIIPIENGTTFDGTPIKGTYYDYHDLENNFIKIAFTLNDDIELITNLINKTKYKVTILNDKNVYNLFRNTESFNCEFKWLDKSTGTLNIRHFDNTEIEERLIKTNNIWLEDLINILITSNNYIIKDDLFNELNNRGIETKDIFSTINYLKKIKILMPKSFIINKVTISYMQMYYKLYYPKEYYNEMYSNIMHEYINQEIYQYNNEEIISYYNQLIAIENSHISLKEREEDKLLSLLVEMIERRIKFKIKNAKIEIGV